MKRKMMQESARPSRTNKINPLPSFRDGKIIYLCWPILHLFYEEIKNFPSFFRSVTEKFTCVGRFFYFLLRIEKLFFCGTWDCHNRMRKEKLPEYSLLVTEYSLMPTDWRTDWVPQDPPTHTRAFQVPKSRCLLFRSQKARGGGGGGGGGSNPCGPGVFFFC
jgi:hypothetical protein